MTCKAISDAETVQGLLRWVDRCNDVGTTALQPFVLAGQRVGAIPKDYGKLLLQHSAFQEATHGAGKVIQLDDSLRTEPERTEAVSTVMRQLQSDGHVPGWRDELYPVVTHWGAEPLLLVERAAAPILGIKGYGVHINGFVRKEGKLWLWVATRSPDKPSWPGKLDHIAAGGQGHGIGLHANVVKESHEEAGIPEHLAQQARAVGAVSYTSGGPNGFGVKRDVLFCFDLELPADFEPQAVDGEVQSFALVPVEEVVRTVAFTDDYKDNCNLVLIDFFLRHGVLSADAPGFLRLLNGLRQADCT